MMNNRAPTQRRQSVRITPDQFAQEFAKIVPQVQAVLPAHIPFEKFERVVRIAVQKNTDLLECSPKIAVYGMRESGIRWATSRWSRGRNSSPLE